MFQVFSHHFATECIMPAECKWMIRQLLDHGRYNYTIRAAAAAVTAWSLFGMTWGPPAAILLVYTWSRRWIECLQDYTPILWCKGILKIMLRIIFQYTTPYLPWLESIFQSYYSHVVYLHKQKKVIVFVFFRFMLHERDAENECFE